jgi:hypothetical protein
MKKIAILTGLAAGLVALPSLAGTSSLIDSFGSFPLDAQVEDTRLRETCTATGGDPTDTSYICPDGLEYIAFDGFITTITFEFRSGGSALGIQAGDTETVVLRKIKQKFGVELEKLEDGRHPAYSTDMIATGTCGAKCNLTFVFDSDGVIHHIVKQPEEPYV